MNSLSRISTDLMRRHELKTGGLKPIQTSTRVLRRRDPSRSGRIMEHKPARSSSIATSLSTRAAPSVRATKIRDADNNGFGHSFHDRLIGPTAGLRYEPPTAAPGRPGSQNLRQEPETDSDPRIRFFVILSEPLSLPGSRTGNVHKERGDKSVKSSNLRKESSESSKNPVGQYKEVNGRNALNCNHSYARESR